MEHLLEFIVNNPFLWGALAVVLVMLIKSEYDHQTNRANQLNPVNATRLMNNHEDAVVLDVRESSDFSKGHIKNAKNVPLSKLKERIDEISKNKETPVLAYCNSGTSLTGHADFYSRRDLVAFIILRAGSMAG